MEDPFSQNEIALKDLINIFRKDQVSEKLTDSLKDGVIEERIEKNKAL